MSINFRNNEYSLASENVVKQQKLPSSVSYYDNNENKKSNILKNSLYIAGGVGVFIIGMDLLNGGKLTNKILKKTPKNVIKKVSETPVTEVESKANRIKIIKDYFKSDKDVEFYKDRPMILYTDIRHDFYKKVRITETPYGLSSASTKDIAMYTGRCNNKIVVSTQNGWHYRFSARNRQKSKVIDRISLNVYPEKKLIQKLDKFIYESGINVEYKTPMSFSGWNKRHDPITMYFREPISESAKNEIIKIVSPHVRKTDTEVMLGKKLSDGIYQVKEPTVNDVEALIQRAKDLNFDDNLVKYLESTDKGLIDASLYSINSKGEKVVRSSPGIIKSTEMLLDYIEKIKNKVN